MPQLVQISMPNDWQNGIPTTIPAPRKSNDWSAVSLDASDWTAVDIPSLFPPDFRRRDLVSQGNRVARILGRQIRCGAFGQHRRRGHDLDKRRQSRRDGRLERRRDITKFPPGCSNRAATVIAIRVLDTTGPGGFGGKPEQMKLELPSNAAVAPISLAGQWLSHKGVTLAGAPRLPMNTRNNPNVPTVLYNAMIAPLQQFPIKGAIWYQGESNNGRARQYRELFPLMIADWRRAWGVGDFPFLFVQIAPHKDMKPEIREAQFLTLAKSPNTAMAVIADVGDAVDIHPARKSRWARGLRSQPGHWRTAKRSNTPAQCSTR